MCNFAAIIHGFYKRILNIIFKRLENERERNKVFDGSSYFLQCNQYESSGDEIH